MISLLGEDKRKECDRDSYDINKAAQDMAKKENADKK